MNSAVTISFDSIKPTPTSNLEELQSQWKQLATVQNVFDAQKRPDTIETPTNLLHSIAGEFIQIGEKKVSQGKLCCILLAAGEGSRLGSNKPKALLPVTPFANKTLLQYQLEKIRSFSEKKVQLPIILICSSKNCHQIEEFLHKRDFFQIPKDSFHLVKQKNLPFLLEGNTPFLQSENSIAAAAYGNGGIFYDLQREGLIGRLEEMGVSHFSVTPIDNPLADPVRPECLGIASEKQCELFIMGTFSQELGSQAGVISTCKSGYQIIDYPYLKKDELNKNFFANLNLFTLSLSFAKKIAKTSLPLHKIQKTTESLGNQVSAWKYEYFITDIVSHAQKVQLHYRPAEDVFFPIKTSKDLAEVKQALVKKDQKILKNLYQLKVQSPIELNPCYHRFSEKNALALHSSPLSGYIQ